MTIDYALEGDGLDSMGGVKGVFLLGGGSGTLGLDASLASRLEPQDSQRIIRGLSVFESTGIPLSLWHAKQAASEQQAKDKIHCPVFVLERPREELRARIASRYFINRLLTVGANCLIR